MSKLSGVFTNRGEAYGRLVEFKGSSPKTGGYAKPTKEIEPRFKD